MSEQGEKKLPGEMPDLSALALGSLFAGAGKPDSAPRPARTREERLAGIADLVRAMEASMEDDGEKEETEP